MTRRPRGRAAVPVAAALVTALLAVACSGGGDGGERSDRSGRPRPESTATPDAPETTAGPGTAAGGHPLGAKWNWYHYREMPAVLAGIERLGGDGGATFFELLWCYAERDDGRPGIDWSLYDSQLGQALDLGYEPMIKLRTGTCALTGGADDGTPLDDPSSLPADPEAYDAFVAEAVARYAARGVHRWAIENEIDIYKLWVPEPSAYEAFATRVAGVVRAADPEAVVYDSGLSGTVYGVSFAAEQLAGGDPDGAAELYEDSYSRGERGSQRFAPGDTPAAVTTAAESDTGRRVREAMEVTLRLARDGVIDRWQFHWYQPVDALEASLEGLRARLPDGFPVEAWEIGFYWPGADYDPDVHSAETVRMVATLLAAGVERVVYLPVFGLLDGDRPHELFRGLYEPGGAPRPAAVAYESLASLTTGARSFTSLGGTGLGIDRPDGSVAVVWDRTLPAPPPGATATDPTGAPVVWTSTLDVGASPVLVHSPRPLDALTAALGR